MAMVSFFQSDPDLAEREIRVIQVKEAGVGNLPPDEYALHEGYCDERGCDCRRVMLTVLSRHRKCLEATISFAFDPDAPMRGPFLDPCNKQGEFASELMDLVATLCLDDPNYVARLERHYRIAKRILKQRPPIRRENLAVFRPTRPLSNAEQLELARRRKRDKRRLKKGR